MNVIAREFALDLALKEYRLHWVEHIFGVTNVEADALSRLNAPIPKDFPETLKSAARRRVKFDRDFWKVPQMPRFKRSLFVPPPRAPGSSSPGPGRDPILHEGFAIPESSALAIADVRPAQAPRVQGPEAKPYERGSYDKAMWHASDPSACKAALLSDALATTSKGPLASRIKRWDQIARQANFPDPFDLSPELIYTVMGAFKLADYRSAEQYLEAAKSKFIQNGGGGTSQLRLAARAAARSCKRGQGCPKQAKGLPLAKLGTLAVVEPLATDGPRHPVREARLKPLGAWRSVQNSSRFSDGSKESASTVPQEWDRARREAEARSEEEARQADAVKNQFLEDTNGCAAYGWFIGRRQREARADISFASFDLQGAPRRQPPVVPWQVTRSVEIRAWLNPRLGETLMHFGVFEKPQSRQWTSAPRQSRAWQGVQATQIKSVQWPQDLTKVDEKACRMKLQKLDSPGIYGVDLSVTAHTEKDGDETLVEPDIGGDLDADPPRVEPPTARRRYENCLDFLDQWEKNSRQGLHMRRLASWTTLVHVDSSKAVWSRMPSMPLIEMSSEEETLGEEEKTHWLVACGLMNG
eukprot:Skav227112  [mRNA]  locus=scaffold199:430834:442141:+ [translate_table: standard]